MSWSYNYHSPPCHCHAVIGDTEQTILSWVLAGGMCWRCCSCLISSHHCTYNKPSYCLQPTNVSIFNKLLFVERWQQLKYFCWWWINPGFTSIRGWWGDLGEYSNIWSYKRWCGAEQWWDNFRSIHQILTRSYQGWSWEHERNQSVPTQQHLILVLHSVLAHHDHCLALITIGSHLYCLIAAEYQSGASGCVLCMSE